MKGWRWLFVAVAACAFIIIVRKRRKAVLERAKKSQPAPIAGPARRPDPPQARPSPPREKPKAEPAPSPFKPKAIPRGSRDDLTEEELADIAASEEVDEDESESDGTEGG